MSNKTNEQVLENLAQVYQQEVSKDNPDYNLLEDIKEQMRDLGCPLSAEQEFEWLPANKKEERMNNIMDKVEAEYEAEQGEEAKRRALEDANRSLL
jgi:hypothetical protein